MTVKAGYAKPTVEFEDIAARIGLDKTSGGRGRAIFDYDNDGYLDIVIGAAYGGTNLYHNNGDGTFTDVSVDSGLDISVNSFATVAGDYNNDGFTDLYITRQGFYVGEGSIVPQQRRRYFHRRHRSGGAEERLGAGVYRIVGRLRWRRLARPVRRQQSGRRCSSAKHPTGSSITTATARSPM